MRWIATALVWLGSRERAFLVSLLLALAGTWGFTEIANKVMEAESKDFDRQLLLAFRNSADLRDPVGPPSIEEMARDVTALGGVAVLSMLTLAAAGYLFLDNKTRLGLFVLVSIGGGVLVSNSLKNVYGRPRPDVVPHGAYVYTSSFPSGHSMMAAATYLTLGALLARSQKSRRIRAYLLLLGVLIALAVGVSRVYLGVHWPTDVLAGWTAGCVWATVCWTLAWHLQRTNTLEPEDKVDPVASIPDS